MPFFPFNTATNSANSKTFSGTDEIYLKISELQENFNEQKSKIDELDDPLSIFDSYYAQLCQLMQNAADSSKLLTSILVPVLDSATQTFARDPRYKNDPRYLKLWLAYAKYCRESEDIFVFLAQEGIAQELATYYEEYSNLLVEKNNLKQANLIYQKGIDKKAQPLERLKKKYFEFQSKHSLLNTSSMGKASAITNKPVEVRGYDSKLINEGDFSFEEIRARNWYAKPKISKPSLNEMKYRLPPSQSINDLLFPPPLPTIQNVENYANVEANRQSRIQNDEDEDDDDGPGLGIAVNPDDLTHINVFKDNTADLREIAKLVKANNKPSAPAQEQVEPAISTPISKKKSDWLLKDILMSLSPIRKKQRQTEQESENTTSTNINISQEAKKSPLKSPSKTHNLTELIDIRLDSIPDIRTDVTVKLNIPPPSSDNVNDNLSVVDYSSLMDPFDLDFKIAQCEAVLSQIASAIPNLNLRLDETANNKVRAFEKSLGRDGSGPNHTVSSLRMASGHFFMEKKLGEGGYGKVFLAVDLMKEDDIEMTDITTNNKNDNNDFHNNNNDHDANVNQVAIKIEAPASVWESYIIFRIQSHLSSGKGTNHNFPRLISASIYSDVSFLVIDYYEQGSLLGALNVYRQQNSNMEEAVVLFYAAELIQSVTILHEAGILHTDIKLENLLILTPKNSGTTSSVFRRDGGEGWNERGLVLIDFGRSIDLKLLKEEERTRFYIKSKHYSFNGSPRIQQGLDVSHEMDWYGVADCLHWLLHQKPLTFTKPPSSNNTCNNQSRLTNSFKRYWQTDLWEPLFDDLIHPPADINAAISIFKGHLERIWDRLENWKKTPSLKSLLTRQEIMLYEHKK